MQLPFLKSVIIGGLLVLVTLLSGCGAVRFAYNQAPDLVYWWLDGYVDFEGAQDERVRDELARFFRWHRASQLPEYAQLLSRAQAQVLAPEPIQPAQVCRWVEDILARADPSIDHALPQFAAVVPLLTPGQVRHIERKFAKLNAKYRKDFLQPDPAERLDAAVERVVERAESLYGALEAPQEALIRRQVAASPFDPDLWLAERQQRQRDTLATLRALQTERAGPDQVQAALRALVARSQRSPREAYRAYDERLRTYNCALGAELHNTMSPRQRQGAARKLKGWEDDVRALAAAAS